jgi:putative ABC transport system permease protein
MVLRQGMLLVAAGILGGWVATAALARYLASLLYGVHPMDPAVLARVSLALLSTAFLAAYLPARRAAGVDPMVALRDE